LKILGRELHTLARPHYNVNAVTVTADGWRVVSASDDHTLKVWNSRAAHPDLGVAVPQPARPLSRESFGPRFGSQTRGFVPRQIAIMTTTSKHSATAATSRVTSRPRRA
jgi:WD40 repeat protein